MYVTLNVSPVQLYLVSKALEIEISTWHGSRMRMTAEPALSIYKRLIADPAGLPVGRGLKGRQEALAIVEDFRAQIKESQEA